MKKGLLITFEGLDGSGKTTQIQKFIENLNEAGLDYQLFREPGGTELGEKIRDLLLDKNHHTMSDVTELLLYSSSRNQLCIEKIQPALKNNKVVICDRFYDSTTAYQGYARGLDLNFIKELNLIAADNLIPDLTFLLDIDLKERNLRLNHKKLDRLEQEKMEFHKKVRYGFLKMAEDNSERFVLIDGSEPVEIISKIIWDRFQKILPGV